MLWALAVGMMTACSQDELTDGTPPVEGKCPLVLTANVGETTRATVDNYWDGGETVYVQIKENYIEGETIDWSTVDIEKCSISTEDKRTIVFQSTSKWANFYWSKDTEDMFIRAWRSGTVSALNLNTNSDEVRSIDNINTPAEWAVGQRQSGASTYKNSDFVLAQKKATFASNLRGVDLTFYHQVAKIVVNVNTAPLEADNTSINNLYLEGVNYSWLPLFSFTAPNTTENYGKWSKPSGNDFLSDIGMRNTSGTQYEAIVIPQTTDSSRQASFMMSVKVTHGSYTNSDAVFNYDFDNVVTWKPGRVYTYNLNLTPTGLKLSSISVNTSWDSTGASGSGEVVL